MADWRKALLKRMGAPATKSNLAFLDQWQRQEGGATNNSATFNWLNTTRGSQYPSINSVGVRAYPDFATGISNLAATLSSGRYPDIVAGLRGGNPYGRPIADDLSVWVSGDPNKGLSYAQRVTGARAASNAPKLARRVANQAPPQAKQADRHALLSYFVASNYSLMEGEAPPNIMDFLPAYEQQARQYGGTTVPPTSKATGTPPKAGGPLANRILQIAHQQVGKPYVWGAESPSEGGFDCSGLIDYAFRQAGFQLPGRLTTYTMAKMGKSVKGQTYRPGDWIITNHGKHVVMYVGKGQVIAAPHTGEVVQYQNLNHFKGSIVDVRRVL